MERKLSLVQEHGNTVSFSEVKPDDAGFLHEPAVNGKVYLTKSFLREQKWTGGDLTITIK